MNVTYKIFAINGSASTDSSNLRLIEKMAELTKDYFQFSIFNDLKMLPHFDPALSDKNAPEAIIRFREQIQNADGIVICTPEYIFSIPSGLKNAIEWCVSTTVFSDKPTGLITASASGEKGHQEMQLIMKTVMAKFTPAATLLIQGVKGKISKEGQFRDSNTEGAFEKFINAFKALVVANG
jgi:NAD(P)H-dependent FMN reductase